MWCDGAKIDAIDVPYRGGGPAMADLIAGHVDLTLPSSQVAKPLVDTKRIKCLAVTDKTRSPALPDVPTLGELGIKHADVDLRFCSRCWAEKPAGRRDGETAKGDPSRAGNARAQVSAEGARHHAGIRGQRGAACARRERRQELGAFIESKGLKGQ